MTAYYVRSGASGSANGSSWANAYTTLAAALSGKAAGDVFYVSEDHSESTAATLTLTFPGTPSNPNHVYCVDHTGSVPPVSADLRTTAVVATTSTNNMTIVGSFYCYGVQSQTGNGISSNLTLGNAAGNTQIFKDCGFALQGTSGGSFVIGSSSSNKIVFLNPTITFGSSFAKMFFRSAYEIIGGSIAASGSVPTTLIGYASSACPVVEFDGVDLSGFGSGKTLIDTTASNSGAIVLKSCKLGASVTPAAAPSNPGSPYVDLINCDSGATNYRTERYRYEGTLTTETTIVRSGGASDGTTPVSHKIVTAANSLWVNPFESFPLAIWNDTVGSSVTVTVYGIWGGGSVPNNDDIWIEAEYLGDSASPKSSIASSGKADGLASGSALTSDASTWGGSTTAFKMSATFTPQQKGLVYIAVKAAKASSTFYIDPKPELS